MNSQATETVQSSNRLIRVMQICFVVVFIGLLWMPYAQRKLGFLPKRKVMNVTIDRKKPIVGMKGVLTGKYQASIDHWFLQNCGLWGVLVTTNNTLNYRFFHQVSTSYEGTAMMGNDNVLFESLYLKDFNAHNIAEEEQLRAQVKLLKTVQDIMESKGKAFVVLVSANKIVLYPQWVPDSLKVPGERTRNVETMRKLFAEYGIHYIDMPSILQEQKQSAEYPFFAKPAAHWNSFGACYASQRVVQAISQQLGKPLQQIQCGPEYTLSKEPTGADRDLGNLINVWDVSPSFSPTPYLKITSSSPEGRFIPRPLFVGTSFLWSVFDVLESKDVYHERDFYYYASTNHSWKKLPDGKELRGAKKVPWRTIDWEKDIFSHDAIVIEINEARIHQIGFHFLKKLENKLKKDPQLMALASSATSKQ